MRTSFSHRVLSIASRGRRLDSDREPAHSRSRSDLDRYPTPNRPRSLEWVTADMARFRPRSASSPIAVRSGPISGPNPTENAEGQRAEASAATNSRVRRLDSRSWSRPSPIGRTRTEMSVTPAAANDGEPRPDHVLVAGGEDVGHAGRVALVEQALVVGRHGRFAEHAVGAGLRRVDLARQAEADRHAGDDARRRSAGLGRGGVAGVARCATRWPSRRRATGSCRRCATRRAGASPARARRAAPACAARR